MITPIQQLNPLSTLGTPLPPIPLQRLQRSLQRLILHTPITHMFPPLTRHARPLPTLRTRRSSPIPILHRYKRITVRPRAVDPFLGVPFYPFLLVFLAYVAGDEGVRGA